MVEAGRRGAGVAVGALAVAGAVLRLWRLGDQGLWYDEWLTARAAGGGFGDVGQHVAHVEGIGPAYFGLMWGWVQLFGDGVVSLRLVSVAFGVATVPAAYAAARALGLRRAVGLAAALVVTVHPLLVWYSREARPYSLLALCGALSLVLFARARAAAGGRSAAAARRAYLAWGVLAAATVSVHYFGVFLFAVEGVVLVRAAWARPRVAVVAVVPPVLTSIVLAPLAASQFAEAGSSWIATFPYADRLEDLGMTALVGPSTPDGRLWLAGALAVALAAGLLVTAGRSQRSDGSERPAWAAGVAAGLGAGGVLLAVLATLVGPDVLVSRYVIASIVPLVVAVAAGLVPGGPPTGRRRLRWAPRLLGAAALVAFVAASLVVVTRVASDPDLQKPDWQAVADVVGAGDGDGDGPHGEQRAVVMNLHGHQGSPLAYHLGRGRSLEEGDVARVREIDVLVTRPTDRPCNYLVGRACALIFLGATLPPAIAARVTLDDRVVLDQFVVERYRSARPIAVGVDSLLGPDAERGLVLVFRTDP